MSNFMQETYHPRTGELIEAAWIDDYFGRHRYGIKFPDGEVFSHREVDEAKAKAEGNTQNG